MNNLEWLDGNRIKIDPPKRPKKITATRFATILGLNPWSTPFEVWCEITKTYAKPFEDTIYTLAGKAIEPKQAQYMRETYFMEDLVSPTDMYGKDYFNKTHGDFFSGVAILGGMWDYLRMDGDTATAVLEMKTTKRAEDWKKDIPEYYALQAALYAYLLEVDDVIMVASFLDEKDYEDPEKFNCNVSNTIIRPFKLSERYPHFEDEYVKPAVAWWREHIESGISPAYDETKDAEIIKQLKTTHLAPDSDITAMLTEAETLKVKIDSHKAAIEKDEKRYKVLTDNIKEYAKSHMDENSNTATLEGGTFNFVLAKSVSSKFDETKFKKEHKATYEKYLSESVSYRLTVKERKEDETK